jgi:hypothetical protein
MPPITDIVNVTISLLAQAATRAGFGTLLVAGDSDKLPTKDVVTLTFDSQLVTSNSIAGTVDGTAITPVVFNASHNQTVTDLITELLLAAGIGTAVASDVGAVGYNNTITCTATNIDTVLTLANFVVTLGASQPTITIARTPFRRTKTYTTLSSVAVDFATTDPEYLAATAFFAQDPNPGTMKIGRVDSGNDWSDEMTLIQQIDNEWYALVITDRTLLDQTDVAAWVKANASPKLFGICSNSADILNSAVSSDIASVIQTAQNSRAFVLYHEDAATSYPDAAWMAKGLSFDPGASTWMFKTLTGVTASPSITDAQRAAAQAKNANLYETYGSKDMTREGNVGYSSATGGDFIDITRGTDWLASDMEERIFALLVASPKVAYTDAGLAQLEQEVRASLDEGIAATFLVEDPASYSGQPYRVTVAKVADIAAAERAARNVPSTALTWQAQAAGAIHTVNIGGTVVL